MATIIVADGEQRSALATVRSLGRAGHRVHVAFSEDAADLAGRSRFAAGRHKVTAPSADRDAFARDLARLAHELGADVVLPVTDVSVQAVLEQNALFADVILPLPSLESFELIASKERSLALARELGLQTPTQAVLAHPDERASLDSAGLVFPAVLKPSSSVRAHTGGGSHRGVFYAEDREQLDASLDTIPSSSYPILVQRRVEGPGMGLFFLLWDGRVIARFAHRRLREKPPSGGVSVLRESMAFDEELGAISLRLLREAEWRGVAMVEFKIDRATGSPFLMEVNGRLWGSLQLAIDAGVDFPRLLIEAALGQDPEPVLDYQVGKRCRWLWGDTDHLLARLRRSRKALDLPSGHPSRVGAVLAYLAGFRPGQGSEVWRWNDRGPFWQESRAWFRELRQRG